MVPVTLLNNFLRPFVMARALNADGGDFDRRHGRQGPRRYRSVRWPIVLAIAGSH